MCIDCINSVSQVIIYILAIILLTVLIVLVIRTIKTLTKVNRIIDDLEAKSQRLDGVFDIVSRTTDVVTSISDKVIGVVTTGIADLFTRNKKKKEEDFDE